MINGRNGYVSVWSVLVAVSLPKEADEDSCVWSGYGQGTVGLWSDLLNHPITTQ